MTLRRRLVLLHSAFAAFAVTAALATIFGVQVYTEQVAERLEIMVDEAQLVDNLRVDLKILDVHLHELVTGQRPADDRFDAQGNALLTRLDEAIRFAGKDRTELSVVSEELRIQRTDLATAIESCVALVRADQRGAATRIFKDRIEGRIIGGIDTQLRRLRSVLDEHRGAASGLLFARNAQLLVVSLVIALGGVGLVVAGAIVVRRRLVGPISQLKAATEAFASGNLMHRVRIDSEDELGVLSVSLNTMAASLDASQRKFKSLFENQRDAVIVCDQGGVIRELHHGDSAVLGATGASAVGSELADIWPSGNGQTNFWGDLLSRVFAHHATVRVTELSVPRRDGSARVVDVVAYPVDYADQPYVALVLRDAAERVRLQKEQRRAETMAAAMTVARGIAHDFKNLLHSAVNTLTLLMDDSAEPVVRERAASALAACEQAASLSRRLSRFAGTDRGNPERLPLAETARLILGSLDEGFLQGVAVRLCGDETVAVEIDRDHLTQIVLNLLVNAREAMPAGGELAVVIKSCHAADPRTPAALRECAVLSVSDTGVGIASDLVDRIFQPFYSSKERGDHGPRGLGLAVVYALVNHAGGFIQVESELGQGSAFHVHFPILH